MFQTTNQKMMSGTVALTSSVENQWISIVDWPKGSPVIAMFVYQRVPNVGTWYLHIHIIFLISRMYLSHSSNTALQTESDPCWPTRQPGTQFNLNHEFKTLHTHTHRHRQINFSRMQGLLLPYLHSVIASAWPSAISPLANQLVVIFPSS